MAFYGRTYTLSSPAIHGLHAPVRRWDTNGGKPGRFTNESGFLSYFEICQDEETWTKAYDKVGECPYAYKSDQWVGYEDPHSLGVKMNWLRKAGYGGAMIWALDLDDYRGVCGEKDILFTTLEKGLAGYKVVVPPASQLTTTKHPNPWWPPASSSSTTFRPHWTQGISTTTTTTTTTNRSTPSTTSTTRFTEPTTAATSQRPVAPSASSTSTRRPEQPPAGGTTSSADCPADSTGQLLSSFRPHPDDNTLYLWCVNGKDLVLACPPGTEWNDTVKQCVGRDESGKAASSAPGGGGGQAGLELRVSLVEEEAADESIEAQLGGANGLAPHFESLRIKQGAVVGGATRAPRAGGSPGAPPDGGSNAGAALRPQAALRDELPSMENHIISPPATN